MEASERDSTQDWLLPASARPPTVEELERRIEEAVATARASEAAVATVGEAALDAAEQARRAAEQAERASRTMMRWGEVLARRSGPGLPPQDESLRSFAARADRVASRLGRLVRIPLTRAGDPAP